MTKFIGIPMSSYVFHVFKICVDLIAQWCISETIAFLYQETPQGQEEKRHIQAQTETQLHKIQERLL